MSNLNVNAINGVDVQNLAKQTARAWVNFNGAGVVAIRKAFNVASVTDHGVGDYTVNFGIPMPDVSYTATGIIGRISGDSFFNVLMENTNRAKTVLAAPLMVKVSTGALEDANVVNAQFFG